MCTVSCESQATSKMTKEFICLFLSGVSKKRYCKMMVLKGQVTFHGSRGRVNDLTPPCSL